MKTKERILEQAVRLFNEQGTPAVSTNHIAEACRISPGNLYYHFRNKQEIIRSVLENMLDRWGDVWETAGGLLSMAGFREMLQRNFALQWEYRFFYRELNFLLMQDDTLRERYGATLNRRMEEQEEALRRYAEAGVLQLPENRTELRDMLTACWVLANNWLSHLESTGRDIGNDQLQDGIRMIETILKPYLKALPK